MEFLFHTIVSFDGMAVYYNVFRATDHYLFQVLQNPQSVSRASDFTLKEVDSKWQCSIEMTEREVEVLVEDLSGSANWIRH